MKLEKIQIAATSTAVSVVLQAVILMVSVLFDIDFGSRLGGSESLLRFFCRYHIRLRHRLRHCSCRRCCHRHRCRCRCRHRQLYSQRRRQLHRHRRFQSRRQCFRYRYCPVNGDKGFTDFFPWRGNLVESVRRGGAIQSLFISLVFVDLFLVFDDNSSQFFRWILFPIYSEGNSTCPPMRKTGVVAIKKGRPFPRIVGAHWYLIMSYPEAFKTPQLGLHMWEMNRYGDLGYSLCSLYLPLYLPPKAVSSFLSSDSLVIFSCLATVIQLGDFLPLLSCLFVYLQVTDGSFIGSFTILPGFLTWCFFWRLYILNITWLMSLGCPVHHRLVLAATLGAIMGFSSHHRFYQWLTRYPWWTTLIGEFLDMHTQPISFFLNTCQIFHPSYLYQSAEKTSIRLRSFGYLCLQGLINMGRFSPMLYSNSYSYFNQHSLRVADKTTTTYKTTLQNVRIRGYLDLGCLIGLCSVFYQMRVLGQAVWNATSLGITIWRELKMMVHGHAVWNPTCLGSPIWVLSTRYISTSSRITMHAFRLVVFLCIMSCVLLKLVKYVGISWSSDNLLKTWQDDEEVGFHHYGVIPFCLKGYIKSGYFCKWPVAVNLWCMATTQRFGFVVIRLSASGIQAYFVYSTFLSTPMETRSITLFLEVVFEDVFFVFGNISSMVVNSYVML